MSPRLTIAYRSNTLRVRQTPIFVMNGSIGNTNATRTRFAIHASSAAVNPVRRSIDDQSAAAPDSVGCGESAQIRAKSTVFQWISRCKADVR
jgi:hypothetical protein